MGKIDTINSCLLEFLEYDDFGSKIFRNKFHPYIVIGKKFLKLNKYSKDDFLSLFHEPHIDYTIHRHNIYLQKDFDNYLKDNFHGNFIVYLSYHQSEKLIKYDKNLKIFGISWIFPWSFAAIKNRFQCYMADTTFKSMKPYTLTILQIIISNESIPVGISVFPTETSSSYNRLFNHLQKCILELDKSFILNNAQNRIICDLGSGLKKFASDNSLELKYCHRHLIEKFGSSSLFGNWVSRIIKTNTQEEFLNLRDIVIKEILIRFPNTVMQIQINTIEYYETNLNQNKLLHKLFDLLGVHLLNGKENKMKTNVWARWNRYGCPTTSNSVESINMHINQKIPNQGTFFDRLKNVESVLMNKFSNFENNFGNNFRKYVESLKKKQSLKQLNVGDCKCGQYLFYSSLFNYENTPCIHTIQNFLIKFKDVKLPLNNFNINTNLFIKDGQKFETALDTLPNSWNEDNDNTNIHERNKINKKKIQIANLDPKNRISWDIIYSIKILISKKIWKGKKQAIISYVLNNGHNIDIENHDQLAQWRMSAYSFAGI